jgi:hypothetical protein
MTPCVENVARWPRLHFESSRTHVGLDPAAARTAGGRDDDALTYQGPLPMTLVARPIQVPQIFFRGPSLLSFALLQPAIAIARTMAAPIPTATLRTK